MNVRLNTRFPNLRRAALCTIVIVLAASCSEQSGVQRPDSSEAVPIEARESARPAHPLGPALSARVSQVPFIVSDDEAWSRYGHLRVTTLAKPGESWMSDRNQLFANGRLVLDTETFRPGAAGFTIREAYAAGDTDFFLVSGDSDGIACPAMYVVVSLRPGDAVQASKPFGTCSDLARSRVADGRLQVDIPRFSNADPVEGWESYLYADGAVAPSLEDGGRTALSRYAKLEIPVGQTRLTADGRTVLDAKTVPMAQPVRLELDQFITQGATDHFLVMLRTEEGACPAKWVLVTLHPGGQRRASRPFGTCEDYASLDQAGGRIVVGMLTRGDPKVWVTYAYDNGRISVVR